MSIRKRPIPGIGQPCSVIVLGGVPLGTRLDERQSMRLMDFYADAGGNMVDTAEVYGNWVPGKTNASEIVIGKWMKSRGNRDRMLVTTKGGHPDLGSMNVSRLHAADIRADAEGSLRRLQADVIDLYWLHRDDRSIPVSELLGSLGRLVEDGLIRSFGCSNWETDRIAEANRLASEQGLPLLAANQAWWSLASLNTAHVEDPTVVVLDEAMYRYHAETGLPLFAYSSLAKGLFAKMEAAARTGMPFEAPPLYDLPSNASRFEQARRIATERGVSISQVALSYIYSRRFPAFAVVGATDESQLADSLGAGDLMLDDEALALLDNGQFSE
ncbi:aldo/keto reductase [Cohnella rhizosphaerae]|uniref:Aldo/keto reductase n=1 Tax=Cohnella rhizosphaerae TaxID=1457232 RepID=A0A9X4KSY9_9BACL|nr:aldo/keto reductase [Cohnella rhizosphaerae]MDG0808179.1 aldo/keto reductase [Cohnella rhizosphaerae]